MTTGPPLALPLSPSTCWRTAHQVGRGQAPAPRREVFVCGDWSLTVWRQKSPALGRRMGSRVGGEGVRRPKSPSLPFSDLQCLVYKTRLLRYVPSMFLYGKTDCFKVKIGLTWFPSKSNMIWEISLILKNILKNKCNKARFVLPGFTTYYRYLKPHDMNTRLWDKVAQQQWWVN